MMVPVEIAELFGAAVAKAIESVPDSGQSILLTLTGESKRVYVFPLVHPEPAQNNIFIEETYLPPFALVKLGFAHDTFAFAGSNLEQTGFVDPSISISYLELVSSVRVRTSVASTMLGRVNLILSSAVDPVVFGE